MSILGPPLSVYAQHRDFPNMCVSVKPEVGCRTQRGDFPLSLRVSTPPTAFSLFVLCV